MSRHAEEKYLEERDRNLLLRKKNNEQENTIKRLYTKIQMIEEGLRRRGHGSTMDASKKSSPSNKLDDRANAKLVDDLRKRNASLKKANTDLREKLRLAAMENKKAAGKRRVLVPRRGGVSSKTAPAMARDENLQGMLKSFANTTNNSSHDRKTRDLVDALRSRLVQTEKRLQRLAQDNKELKIRAETTTGIPSSPRASHHAHSADTIELQRELRDKNAQLTLLNSRFEHLEGRHRAGQEMHNRALSKMEDDNRTIRDMRRKLQLLGAEKESLEGYKERCADLEQEVGELRKQTAELEESMGRLCESPFINTAYKSEREMMELRKHRKDAKHQQYQIDFLQEAVKSWRDRVADMTQKLQGAMNEKEALSKEKAELEIKLEEYDRSNELLKDKMRLYSGETGIDTADLERALTLVKRNSERPADVDFLDKDAFENGNVDEMEVVPALRRKVQTLQIKTLEQVRELERADRMLKAQSSINRDLNTELETLKARYTGDRTTLQKKVDDMEHVAAKRSARVKTLEAQLKQFIRNGGANVNNIGLKADEGEDGPNVGTISASPGLASGDQDFEPGENLLEVYVVNGTFLDPKDISPGAVMFAGRSVSLDEDATTFIMCDFYDYETQTTPIMTGLSPQYNFAATYKVEVDHFFLRHLSSESLVLEINLARHADFELVGQVALRLVDIINDQGSVSFDDAPILSVRDGSVIGHLNVKMKMALPVTELFQLYLKENPSEKSRVERLRLADQTVALDQADKARQSNYLEVVIVRCTKLRTRHGRDPAAFVGYKLFNFQDVVTKIADEGCDPAFDSEQALPLQIDRKLMRALRKESLQMTVFDDLENGDEPIGVSSIPLTALAEGEPVVGAYDLRSPSGSFAGQIHVSIRWRIPLRMGGSSGYQQQEKELTNNQVRFLERRFESSKRDGNVNYKHFLQYMVPRAELLTIQNKLRDATNSRKHEANFKQAIKRFERDPDTTMSFDDLRDALEEVRSGLLSDTELRVVFQYLDANEEGSVDPGSFRAFALNPNMEEEQVTEDKVRAYFRPLHRARPNFREEFHRFDRDQLGVVTRPEFRQALTNCGMELVEEAKFDHDRDRGGGGGGTNSNEHSESNSSFNKRDKRLANGERAGNQELNSNLWGRSAPGGEDIISETSRATKKGAPRSQHQKMYDNLNHSLKQDFQTRMEEANEASRTAAAVNSVPPLDISMSERNQIKKSNETQEEHAAALRLQAQFRSYDARKRMKAKRHGASNDHDETITTVTHAENELKDKIQTCGRKFQDIEHAISRHDNGNGKITRSELKNSLESVNIHLTRQSLVLLFQHFDRRGDGKMRYKDFVRFALQRPSKGGEVVRKLRRAIWKTDPATAFKKLDKNEDGRISKSDFRSGIKRMGIKGLSDNEIDELMGHFKHEKENNYIDLDAFIDFAADAHRGANDRLGNAENALKELISKAVAKGIDIKRSFKAFDKNNDGMISKTEFAETISQLSESLSINLTNKEVNQLFSRFSGSARSTYVDYQDFVAYFDHTASSMKDSGKGSRDDREKWIEKTKNIEPVKSKQLHKKAFHVTREAARQEHDILQYFERYDTAPRRNRVRTAEFISACEAAGFFFTLSEGRWLCEKFKSKGTNDGVSYNDFLFWATESAARVQAVSSKLKVLIANAALMRTGDEGHLDFSRVFRAFDPHDTKRITPKAFKNGLDTILGSNNLTTQEVQTLMDHFDTDADGNIRYDDFIVFVLGEDAAKASTRRPKRPAPKKRSDAKSGTKKGAQEAAEEAAAAVKKLKSLVRQAAQKGVDYRSSFEHFDPALTGRITRTDFKRGLKKLGIVLLDDEMDATMNRFDPDNSGQIRYGDFLTVVAPQGERKQFDKDTDRAISKLRDLVRARAKQKKGSLRDPFSHFSEKKASFVSSQLHEGLKLLGIDLPADKVSLVFEMMDKNGDGVVTYNEFKIFIGDSHYIDVENRLRSMITRLASKWDGEKDFKRVFRRFDEENEGSISRRRFGESLDELGFDLSSSEFERVLDRFDVDGDGKVSYKEFVKFVSNRYDQYKPIKELKDILRSTLRKMGLTDKDMWQTFRNFDLAGNGYINQHEFRDGLKDMGFKLTGGQSDDLMQYFDFYADGRISYEEFVAFVTGEKVGSSSTRSGNDNRRNSGTSRSARGGSLMHRVRKAFRKKWSAGNLEAYDIFEAKDTKFDGYLPSTTVFKILSSSFSVKLSEQDEDNLMTSFANDDPDAFDYVKFLHRAAPSYHGSSTVGTTVASAASELRLLVRQRAATKGGDLKDPFNHFDRKRNGYFNMKYFSKGLGSLGVTLSSSDEEKLFGMIDFNNDGKVRFNEFAVFVNGVKFTDAASRLRCKITRIAKRWNGGRDMRKAFDRFDDDRTGFISKRGFSKAMVKFGFDFSKHEVEQLLHKFDVDGDGQISYREFLDFVNERVSAFTDIEAMAENIRDKVKESAKSLWETFEQMDTDGNGVVDKNEFQKGLRKLGLDVSVSDLRSLMKYFDHHGHGKISWEDFAEFINDGIDTSGKSPTRRPGRKDKFDAVMVRVARAVKGRLREDRKFSLRKTLGTYDRRSKGFMYVKHFKQCLVDDLELVISSSDMKALVSQYVDEDDDDIVKYERFVDDAMEGSAKSSSGSRRKSSNKSVQHIVKRIRTVVRNAWKEGTDYHDSFERFDSKGKGWISHKDFLKGLKELNITLDSSQEEDLMMKFDPEESGELDYHVFLEIIAPSYNGKGAGTDDDSLEVQSAANKLRTLVKARARDMENDFKDPFRHFDKKENGYFNSREFEKGLGKLKIKVRNTRNVGKLFRMLDMDNDGKVRFNEFCMFVWGTKHTDAFSRLRAKITQLARGWGGGKNLKKAFSRFDRDNNGYVTRREFREALQSNGFDFSRGDIDQIVHRFDRDGEGRVTFDDFLKFVDDRMQSFENVSELHSQIRKKIKASAKKSGSAKNILAVFEQMDADCNGRLDKKEFAEGLEDLGFGLKRNEVNDLVKYFDHHGDGNVCWEDFADFVEHKYDSDTDDRRRSNRRNGDNSDDSDHGGDRRRRKRSSRSRRRDDNSDDDSEDERRRRRKSERRRSDRSDSDDGGSSRRRSRGSDRRKTYDDDSDDDHRSSRRRRSRKSRDYD